jgi:hypothetical protein
MNIRLGIPEELMHELDEKLDGIKNPNAVVKSAVNYTADRLQRELARRTQAVYRYQGGEEAVLNASTITKANVKNPAVEIRFVGSTIGIEKFHVEVDTEGNGVYGAVKKKTTPVLLKKETGKAFQVKFKSGHIAIVYRATEREVNLSRAEGDRYRGTAKHPYRYNQHTAPLRLISSPAIPSMVKSEEVYGHLREKYQNILEKQVRKVMEKAIYG